jgi:hypothetical protein
MEHAKVDEECMHSFGRKSSSDRRLGKHRHRWENIKFIREKCIMKVRTSFNWLSKIFNDGLL